MNEELNPWGDDDYTAPGEAALRAYCEEEEAPETWGAVELAWFRPVYQPCAGGAA